MRGPDPSERDRCHVLAHGDVFWAPVFAVAGILGVLARNLHRMLWWWPLCLPVVVVHTLLIR